MGAEAAFREGRRLSRRTFLSVSVTATGGLLVSLYLDGRLGAKTRAMLVAAAAERWKVAPGQCRTENSLVHSPDGRSATYAELAEAAARIPVPAAAQLKSSSEFRLVGKPVRRLDGRAKCDGS